MRFIAVLAIAAIVVGCSPSTGPRYLNADGVPANRGEGKREINTGLADLITKDDR